MTLNPKTGRILLASLLFGTFALHSLYRARATATEPPLATLPSLAALPSLMTEPSPPKGSDAPGIDTSDGKVHLTAVVDRSAVLQRSDGIVHVEVTVRADALPGPSERTPTDLVVVMDHSGSMQGQKLDHAKEALLGLIDRIGDDDRLGVVIFDDATRVLFPLEAPSASRRELWRGSVRAVESEGGTSILAGLDVGLGLMGEHAPGRTTRVLLLSDGQDPTALPTLLSRARGIVSRQAVLSTLGIGQDFDERVMTSLASAGTGAFYYMAKPDMLPAMLDAELKTATETYASGAQLRLHVGDGVRVTNAGGLPLEVQGGDVIVPIGSLYAARERKVWLGLSVPTEQLVEHELGKMRLTYQRSGAAFEISAAALPKVACVADQSSYEARIDAPVWGRAMLEEELTRAREELGDAIASGTAADVDRTALRVERERRLAERLGQSQVVQEITDFRSKGSDAKLAQQAAPAVRNGAAKREKAMGFGKRNASSYAGTDWSKGF
jgi:Ca-activated chloride channel family protein